MLGKISVCKGEILVTYPTKPGDIVYSLQLKCYSLLSSTAKRQSKKIKTSVDPSTALPQCHGGPLILVVGLLNSHFSPVAPRSSPVGQCFSDTSIHKLYFRNPQENPPNWYSKRMQLYPEASLNKKNKIKKKAKAWLNYLRITLWSYDFHP